MQVFLDMDGVLVDFIRGAHEAHGIAYTENPYTYTLGGWEFIEETKMEVSEFWQKLDRTFWANLKWTKDGQQILRILETLFKPENICILSSPCLTDGCLDGKRDWIGKNLPRYSKSVLLGTGKHFVAHKEAILVDDADHNVNAFNAAGGLSILVPRPWNTLHTDRHAVMESLNKQLEPFQRAT